MLHFHAPSTARPTVAAAESHTPMLHALSYRMHKVHGSPLISGSPAVVQSSPRLVGVRRLAPVLHAVKPTIVAAASVEATSTQEAQEVENVVIIGSGPAGYTAAIYAARANLKPVIFEGFRNGRGGQLMTTTEVENFPGFPEGITGPDLMDRMRKQAERWGSELHTEDVEEVDLSVRPFRVRSTDRELRAHSVIIATGASAKRLDLPSEREFWSRGISACAICDGASPLFKNGEVAVVGGGDSATEEAVYLTKYAKHVHLLVRGERMRASKAMQDRALANPRVTVHFNTGVEDAFGGEVLEGLKLFDTRTGEKRNLAVKGLFYGIGHTPNSKLVAGQVDLDEAGYVKVQHGASTSVPGVFAAGDLHDTEWRQAITAAGSGCMAALAAERYLTANSLVREFKQPEDAAADGGAAHHAGNGANGNGANGNGNGSSAKAATSSVDTPETFDINADKHKGQYALRKLYHESKRLICVLYTAPTCGPCRTLKPIFNAVVDEYKGKVHYVEIDIEQDPEIAEAAGVMGTPTVQMFMDKARVEQLSGVKMKKDYREIFNRHLGVEVKVAA
ncbi:hypothetical protein PLESTB_000814200 [Pleodorina starrii]|uniref:Thioredoxin reductase n=1 Tax=Pleodorina starrii TaxID=330485 RepID=A0A9W6BKN1_9CHLO|nr:hypothetical protein PLESTM_000129800 [Pleodorina starrii]GLC54011.1 hypothetical protein PLESTB_000814200 [Pleodorina starrii]GLC64682.1 hypothetical protein PLESTF_000192000 [Pleodorina starrii]